jgi:hypothetical protein
MKREERGKRTHGFAKFTRPFLCRLSQQTLRSALFFIKHALLLIAALQITSYGQSTKRGRSYYKYGLSRCFLSSEVAGGNAEYE